MKHLRKSLVGSAKQYCFKVHILWNSKMTLRNFSKSWTSAKVVYKNFQGPLFSVVALLLYLVVFTPDSGVCLSLFQIYMMQLFCENNERLSQNTPLWTFDRVLIRPPRLTCQAGIYLFKVNNGNTKTMCEICSKFSIKTPERPSN